MSKDELKNWIQHCESQAYSMLRMLSRESVEGLKSYGYQSFEAALKGTIKNAQTKILKEVEKYEKENL